MSVQFGQWNFGGHAVDAAYVAKVRELVAPYGPDGLHEYARNGAHLLYLPFQTTPESHRENQPVVLPSGAVLTWDGRLDNRRELLRDLRDEVPFDATDADIVAAAYGKWQAASFPKFVGDWALAVWSGGDRSLILASDFLATRHLYYAVGPNQATWCTVLDPFVLLSTTPFELDEEYIAGWLGLFPAAHLTPYREIHRVPCACYVVVTPHAVAVRRYWDFDSRKRIRYRRDTDYEEHFRSLFAQAVQRRLRSDAPVLAELSGGMDSSSIVCTADAVIAAGEAATPRLDTISYYDDAEPNWDEKSYFTKVEEKRGRTGRHIDVGATNQPAPPSSQNHFSLVPEFIGRTEEATRAIVETMRTQGNRVILSGTGGDEVLGGVPTPLPELGDLLAEMHLRRFLRQWVAWSLEKRTAAVQLLFELLKEFLPTGLFGFQQPHRPADWLDRNFAKRQRAPLAGYVRRLKFLSALPSFQENRRTLDGLGRQMACTPVRLSPLSEKRYPFLDRDLLEFLFAIPRDELVRPGRRRWLMRRAFAGVVPKEILERKRKAFVVRSTITRVRAYLSEAGTPDGEVLLTAALGVVDRLCFSEAVAAFRAGKDVPVLTMLRTIALEHWLRQLRANGIEHFPECAACSHSSFPSRSLFSNVHSPQIGEQSSSRKHPYRFNQAKIMRKAPVFVLPSVVLAGVLILFHCGLGVKAQSRMPHPFGQPVYHDYAPIGPLPPTLDPIQFRNKRAAFVAYTLAGQIKDTLYQVPCYCACNRTQGHQSLLDCFTSRHGVNCPICQKEAIFCFEQHEKGMDAKRIRQALEKGQASTIEVENNPDRYLRARGPSVE